jgi:hypothetical protein
MNDYGTAALELQNLNGFSLTLTISQRVSIIWRPALRHVVDAAERRQRRQ